MIYCSYIDLPYSIKGFTKMDADGNFCIVLNSRYSYPQLQRTLRHELNHIKRGDFGKGIPAHIIERDAI